MFWYIIHKYTTHTHTQWYLIIHAQLPPRSSNNIATKCLYLNLHRVKTIIIYTAPRVFPENPVQLCKQELRHERFLGRAPFKGTLPSLIAHNLPRKHLKAFSHLTLRAKASITPTGKDVLEHVCVVCVCMCALMDPLTSPIMPFRRARARAHQSRAPLGSARAAPRDCLRAWRARARVRPAFVRQHHIYMRM